MSLPILPEVATEILVPLAAIVGIVFSLVQWVLVSKVKMSLEDEGRGNNGGPTDSLIEEEEGLNNQNVVAKCAEIQKAISEGKILSF
jgi:H+-translocating diphosphatase